MAFADQARPDQHIARFNTPFELGVVPGAHQLGAAPQCDKRCLVLEAERYRYQK